MLSFTTVELHTWIAAFLWPLTRVMGLIAAAPLFGNVAVPASVKVLLGALLTIVIAPGVPAMPAADPVSWTGLLILTQQLIIGLAMGFSMRVVFAGIELAGEVAGMTMGLGFATFYDPNSQGHSSAIGQFLSLLALMLFLSTNLHLVLLATLADSFQTLPVGVSSGIGNVKQLSTWGLRIFSVGLQLSLPLVAALLMTNAALGILTRAAPQLNLFGIGFPVTIGVGFLMLAVALPYFAMPLDRLFADSIANIRQMTVVNLPLR